MERVLTAKGAATRQRIVEGAALLVRERGVANVGLDDIRAATATGKADLMLAVAKYEAGQVIADQMPQLGDLTTWRKWQAWRRRVIEIYDVQRQGCALSALTSQLAAPSTRQVVNALTDEWYGYLADGVRALKASGEIDARVDVPKTATAILAAVTGGATLLQSTDRLDYLEDALTEALEGMRRPH
jgi:AcrR family transcriptional regulator